MQQFLSACNLCSVPVCHFVLVLDNRIICFVGHYIWQRLGVASPGDQFLRSDEVDVGEGEDRVDELEEAVLAVGPVEEPGGVEEEGEGRLALGVVLQEVLGEDLLDSVRLLGVETAVSHGARATSAKEITLH